VVGLRFAVSEVRAVSAAEGFGLDFGALADRAADRVAGQVADRVAAALAAREAPWLNVEQAAAYLAAPRSRIHDLVAAGQLRCARDGRRLLFRREWLDDALEVSGGAAE
jgi:excisionase family DNA binding protein